MGVLDLHLWTDMASETAGIKENLPPAFVIHGLDKIIGDDDFKALRCQAFSSCTKDVIDIALSTSCSDMQSTMPLTLRNDKKASTLQDDKSDAFDVSELEKKACLEGLPISEGHHGCELVRDAITWPEAEILSHQSGNASQLLNYSCPPSGGLTLNGELSCLKYTTEFPLVGTFIDMLESCRQSKNPSHAKQLSLLLCDSGLEVQKDVGNYLVPVLVECGALDYAQQMFCRLTYQNEHSWTSLIQGHAICENYKQALSLYNLMLDAVVEPSSYTFVVLLKVCAETNNVERGQFFHTAITKRGLEEDPFVSSVLVDMYTKCGVLSEAKYVVNQMPVQDIFPWTSIISGYVELGLANEALLCMEQLGKMGLSLDAHAIACVLKGCSELGLLDTGFKLHTQVSELGFARDVFVCNALMDMYAHCGAILEVQKVFEGLPFHDIVSWTTMIAAYVELGCTEEALGCLETMQKEGFSPVAATFVCVLKSCTNISAIHHLRFLHSEALKNGIEGDVSFSNSLVDVYAKCGSLEESLEVLCVAPIQTAVTWTALMAGYVEQEIFEKVIDCYEQLKMAALCPDETLTVCILKACANLGALEKGREIHINIAKIGFDDNMMVGNTLISMYAKCGAIQEAHDVFEKQIVHNVVSWNALLAAYSGFGQFSEAWFCYYQMKLDGVLMDMVTYACILKACGSRGAIDKGHELHIELLKKGYETDIMVANTLIDMYSKCWSLEESQSVFDMLEVPVLVSWNALLQAYTLLGCNKALSCYQQMQLCGYSPDVVTWNTIILFYAEQGEKDKACSFYARMLEQGVLPNDVVFVSMLKACHDSLSIETVRRLHAQLCRIDGYKCFDATIPTTLIDTYSKCYSLKNAHNVIEALRENFVEAWSALITGYAGQGNSKLVFSSFFEMTEKHVQPDEVTFLGIISVCSHAGLLEEGQNYFEIMCTFYGIVPDVEHLTCMANLFGRSGQLDLVMKLVEESYLEVDTVVWQTVMDACSRSNPLSGSKPFNEAAILG